MAMFRPIAEPAAAVAAVRADENGEGGFETISDQSSTDVSGAPASNPGIQPRSQVAAYAWYTIDVAGVDKTAPIR